MAVDDTDRRILAALQRDGRASVRDLAAELHLSRANAYARVKRLQDDGVIRGYTAVVDHAALGDGLSAYVSVRIKQNAWKRFREKALEMPELVHLALVTGEVDGVMLVRARDAEHRRQVVLERVQAMPEVLASQTVLVFEEDRGPAA